MLPAVHPDQRTTALAAVAGGILLGVLDFLWITSVPYPFAELGNSTATWAVAAFAFGYWVRSARVRPALAAAVLLVVAVPSYYLAAALIQGDALAVLWQPSSLFWMFLGVLAGVVFGTGGAWVRKTGWRQIVGIALPAAVFFEEAARFARRTNDPNYPSGYWWNVAIDVALAVLIVALIGRTFRQRALALVTALPLAAIVFLGFTLVG
ncbi:DUF6518 family protein [Micromonospora azadirachtae]|uniref:DUF6518 family protein n=1 Tax=Micromonospora azadirachtae TaxID=1970735 RepID=A0ABW2ZVB4_9ACTN